MSQPEEKKQEGAKTKEGCCGCDKETVLPSGILDREDFCDVNNHGRKCTDCFCCIIFLLFLAAWGGCFVVAWSLQEPLSLIYARDYKGRLCGVGEFENQTRTYYPRLKDDLLEYALATIGDITSLDFESLINSLDFDLLNLTGVCVESCPTVYEVVCTPDYLLDNPLPTNSELAECYGGELVEDEFAVGILSLVGVDIPRNEYFTNNLLQCTNCWNVLLNTTEIFFRCFDIITTVGVLNEVCTYPDMREVDQYLSDGSLNPDWVSADDNQCLTKRVVNIDTSERPTYDNPLAELMGSTLATLQSWASDVYNSWVPIVVVGVGGAVAFGFAWIALLRVCTGCIVWGTIVGFLLLLMGGAGYCWLMTGYFDTAAIASWVADAAATVGLDDLASSIDVWVNTTDFGVGNVSSDDISVTSDLGLDITTDTQTLWRIGAFGITIIFVVALVLVIVVAKKIAIAIAIIEEASVAILRMPCLVFFPFLTAIFIMVNGIFLIFSVSLLASAETVSIDTILDTFTGYFNTNCSEYNATGDFGSSLDAFTSSYDQDITNYTNLVDAAANTASTFVCNLYNVSNDQDIVTFLNWFQLFCFLWNNAVLQGIGIMVVAGAVADWYWTRPSFDKSVPEEEWMEHLENARSFHGIPEGKFVERGGRWDLMLNVDRLALNDEHVVEYQKNDTTHRQLLVMRGYETEPVKMTVDGESGTYVRFNMEKLATWKTGLRQGVEQDGEDPRAFYSIFDQKSKPCSRAPSKVEIGLKSCLEHGKVTHPGWGDHDIHGVPAWRETSATYYPHIQDPRGYYGPVDPNFGKIITTPEHQRLNDAYVHQMTVAGKLRKGGNGRDFKWPFCASIYRTFRYHLGSICVGGFIIALVQLIRIIMAYIDKHTKTWQNKNKCFAAMFKVIHLCLCLLERCLKYITKNAFIMVAMRGKPFCESCCASFKLLLTNLVQFVIVGVFSKVVVAIGKIFIVVACCAACYGWIKVDSTYTDTALTTYITNTFIPVTLVGLLAFGIASAFLHVYDLAIATILLCFCEDYKYHNVGEASKMHDHDEVYMPSSLRNIVLPPESRHHLPHAMTYEEIRLYSASVHELPHPHSEEHHPCTGKKPLKLASAKVAPLSKTKVAPSKKPENAKPDKGSDPAPVESKQAPKSEPEGDADII